MKMGGHVGGATTRETPQGGVVSPPLLANIYLHWFDRVFYAKAGPARWAKAVLVRYADDFVILTREVEGKLRKFVEEKIEVWLGLRINREKTRLITCASRGKDLTSLVTASGWIATAA